MRLKETAKKIRASQPLNRWLTDSVKLFVPGEPPEFIMRYLPRSGEVKNRLPNGEVMRLWSYADEQVTNHLYWRGWEAIEPETRRIFFHLARESRVTFDIGAHIGSYALLAAAANPAGQVYAFEALPPVYARLKRNIEFGNLTNVKSYCVAVGEKEGDADFFHIPYGIPSSSSLSYEFMSQPGVPIVSTRVPVVALDNFLRDEKITQLDLVKMDTEETEPDVMRGMLGSLRRFRPRIFCEVLKKENKELEAILQPLGYEYYLLTADGPILRKNICGAGFRDNYLFLPNLAKA